MKRHRGLRAFIILGTTALTLAACGGTSAKTGSSGGTTTVGGLLSGGTSGSSGTSSAPQAPVSTTTVPAMSSADYKQKLTAVNTVLAADFGTLRKTHTLDEAKAALAKLSQDANSQGSS